MKVDTYECDVCHAQKKEANHWWLIVIWSSGGDREPLQLTAAPWSMLESFKEDHEEEAIQHICGEACVQKKVAEFLGMK